MTPPTPHECTCPNSAFDERCHPLINDPFGGLGCNFCGHQTCRICGVDGYPDCPGVPPTEEAVTDVPVTPEPEYECDECAGTKYDWRCGSGQDPFGGLGCNHCGLQRCRICDENPDTPYISCSQIPDRKCLNVSPHFA